MSNAPQPSGDYTGNASKSYNAPDPHGMEFVPAEGTVPKPLILSKLTEGIL